MSDSQEMELSKFTTYLREALRDATKLLWVVCGPKLQALVYDILPWRDVPESDARSVVQTVPCCRSSSWRRGHPVVTVIGCLCLATESAGCKSTENVGASCLLGKGATMCCL